MKYFHFSLFLSLIFSSSIISQDHINLEIGLKNLISEKKIIGASAAYSVNGKTVWSESKGYACREDRKPFTNQTLNRTASLAKPMTAIAIMQLVEAGKLDINLSVDTYITDLPSDKGSSITVKHLLQHTSGIDSYGSSKETETKMEYTSLKLAVDIFKDRALMFEPGTKFSYSSYGYVVLGRIIEEVSGLTYENYIQKYIWDVADMKNTGVEKYHDEYENKSKLYHRHKRKSKDAKKNNLSNRIPAGGFYSTTEDLIKFGNAVLNNSLISQESLNVLAESSGMKKEGNGYGMGWYLYGGKELPSSILGHSGAQTGCSNQIMIIPDIETVIVVHSNTSGLWNDVVQYSVEFIPLANEKFVANKN